MPAAAAAAAAATTSWTSKEGTHMPVLGAWATYKGRLGQLTMKPNIIGGTKLRWADDESESQYINLSDIAPADPPPEPEPELEPELEPEASQAPAGTVPATPQWFPNRYVPPSPTVRQQLERPYRTASTPMAASPVRSGHAAILRAARRHFRTCLLAAVQGGYSEYGTPGSGGNRRQDCHSAAPPSPFSGCFRNGDEEGRCSKMTVSPTARRRGVGLDQPIAGTNGRAGAAGV